MSEGNATGVVAAVQRDHREIEQMLDDVEAASGDERGRAFERLAAKLRAHETAEEQVVHPLAKKEGNTETVTDLVNEEDAASKALQKLEGLPPDSKEFDDAFQKLKKDVLAHAKEEERDEHPRLMSDTPADELERREAMFEQAEAKANK